MRRAAIAILTLSISCGGSSGPAPAEPVTDPREPTTVSPTDPASVSPPEPTPLRECEARRDEPPLELAAARSLISTGGLLRNLSVPLPTAWPPADDRVQFFGHESLPLPTGQVLYRVYEPDEVHVLSTIERTHTTRRLTANPAVLGRVGESPGYERAALNRAISALLDVATRRRCPEDAREDLGAYCEWLTSHPIGIWAQKHVRDFSAWLECPGAGGIPEARSDPSS